MDLKCYLIEVTIFISMMAEKMETLYFFYEIILF